MNLHEKENRAVLAVGWFTARSLSD